MDVHIDKEWVLYIPVTRMTVLFEDIVVYLVLFELLNFQQADNKDIE